DGIRDKLVTGVQTCALPILEPLSESESTAYIRRRLHLAGANSAANAIFPDAAVQTIFRYSRGIPRLINTICENALISGYARQTKIGRASCRERVYVMAVAVA